MVQAFLQALCTPQSLQMCFMAQMCFMSLAQQPIRLGQTILPALGTQGVSLVLQRQKKQQRCSFSNYRTCFSVQQ